MKLHIEQVSIQITSHDQRAEDGAQQNKISASMMTCFEFRNPANMTWHATMRIPKMSWLTMLHETAWKTQEGAAIEAYSC